MYDGPCSILSIVDNRTFKRLAYKVLDHDPTRRDRDIDIDLRLGFGIRKPLMIVSSDKVPSQWLQCCVYRIVDDVQERVDERYVSCDQRNEQPFFGTCVRKYRFSHRVFPHRTSDNATNERRIGKCILRVDMLAIQKF